LAIAAAAIAASMSATAATPAASSAQAKIDSGAAAAVIADPTAATADAAAIAADTTATIKTGIQASTGRPTPAPVKPQTAAPVTTVATAVAATAPVAPKTTTSSKAAAATPTGTATSGSSKTTPGATDPAATTAQPAATTGTQDASGSTVDAAKSDASANPLPTSVVAGTVHERSAGAETGHTPTDTSGAGAQALGSVGPQLLSATTGAAPTPSLSVTAATNAPVPLSGLALEIAASVKNGRSSFEIRLDPADLGRIDVRIDVDRTGQVTSHLTVEKPETLSMLRQDAPQLQRALDDAGLKTGSGGLQFSLRDQSSSSQNSGNQTGSNAQRLVVSEEDTIPAAVAGRTYGRMLGSSSGVDIRV
jgi:flagellar hook-length control protein FliK